MLFLYFANLAATSIGKP